MKKENIKKVVLAYSGGLDKTLNDFTFHLFCGSPNI